MENKIETQDADWAEVHLKRVPRQMHSLGKASGKNLQNDNLMDLGRKDSKMELLMTLSIFIQFVETILVKLGLCPILNPERLVGMCLVLSLKTLPFIHLATQSPIL